MLVFRFRLFAMIVALLPCLGAHGAAPAPKPELQQVSIGDAVGPLTGPWRFHPGDDPAWAGTDFDDSTWPTLDLTPPEGSFDPTIGSSGYVPGWTATGYPRLTGYSWYRLRVKVREAEDGRGRKLALKMPDNFDDAYQVYVNGRLIGQFGKFTPRAVTYYLALPRAFDLPEPSSSGVLTIAIRFWMDAASPYQSQDAGGMHSPPVIGDARVVDTMLRLEWDDNNRTVPMSLLVLASTLLALILGFALYLVDRSDPAYLWLGIAHTVRFASGLVALVGPACLPGILYVLLADVLLPPAALATWILFWAYWLRVGRPHRMQVIAWSLCGLWCMSIALLRPPLFGVFVPVEASVYLPTLVVVLKFAAYAVVLWVSLAGIRRDRTDGWLVLIAVLSMTLTSYETEAIVYLHLRTSISIAGVLVDIGPSASLLTRIVVAVLLLRRFLRGLNQSQRMETEMEQARHVQQLLVPEVLPGIAGFEVRSEYLPAKQVGGDFFQVLALEEGGMLVAIGDVSGKGMPAAMTVSMLIGVLSTEARYTDSPAVLLTRMNARMIGRHRGGFTTCLIVRMDSDGVATTASAGHLLPYLAGREIPLEGNLPLGLSAIAAYAETRFQMEPGQQLTMLTDGVVEARSRTGELFGFDRTAALASLPAKVIAQSALDFGQEDDITVLSVVRLAPQLQ